MNELGPLLAAAKDLGPFGVVVYVGWLVITGRLRLAREVEDVKDQLSREREERKTWQAAAIQGMKIADRATSAVVASNTPPAVVPAPQN